MEMVEWEDDQVLPPPSSLSLSVSARTLCYNIGPTRHVGTTLLHPVQPHQTTEMKLSRILSHNHHKAGAKPPREVQQEIRWYLFQYFNEFVAVWIFLKDLNYYLVVWPGLAPTNPASIVCEINLDFCKINWMISFKLIFCSAESFMFDVVAVRCEIWQSVFYFCQHNYYCTL